MKGTHLTRTCLSIALMVCSAIVLGLSVDIEMIVRDHGNFIRATSTFPYSAWVGAFTILFELIFMLARLLSDESILGVVAVEMVWALIMFPIWLAACALVTIRTRACDVSFGLSSSFCSKVDATAAFLWIGWAAWLFILFTLVYIIGSYQGDKRALKEHIPTYEPKPRNSQFAPMNQQASPTSVGPPTLNSPNMV